MSNRQTPRTRPPGARPEKPWLVPAPDALTFEQQWRVKGATGIDVLNPPIRGLAIAACLWFASREWGSPLSWEECREANLDDVELAGVDEELDEDEEDLGGADPTHGSATPSNE